MGQDLVNTDGARAIVGIDPRNVNYGLAKSTVEKYIKSVGGGSGGKNFPGTQIYFKSGEWFAGFKDQKRGLKAGTQLVFNTPNMMSGWCKWVGDEGSRKPQYTPMTFVAAGDDPISRESLGDTDQDEWDLDDYGKPQDPWKPVLVFPVRKAGSTDIHHVMLDTISKCIAGFNLFRDIADEMMMHEGELPIISLGSKKASQDKKVTDKKGKTKSVKQAWDVPTFEVVGWDDAVDADNPTIGGVQVKGDEGEADVGAVETKARTNGKKLAKTQPAATKKAEAKKPRKTVEVADEAPL